jgi:hypothetical protein
LELASSTVRSDLPISLATLASVADQINAAPPGFDFARSEKGVGNVGVGKKGVKSLHFIGSGLATSDGKTLKN